MNNSTLWSNSSSTALKFNVSETPSRIKQRVEQISLALPCFLLALLNGYFFQSWNIVFVILVLATLLLTLSVSRGFFNRFSDGLEQALLSAKIFYCNPRGELSLCATEKWQIQSTSKVVPWGCCISLRSLTPSFTEPLERNVWIYSDMLPDDEYKSLCRIVNACAYQYTQSTQQ
ncbi:protein YgfX [Thalassotalea litorea]|uniref:protein YgfX n=1 Tax=Thalassotalea litorea TaxID=2020715 RepID=UPI003734ED1E